MISLRAVARSRALRHRNYRLFFVGQGVSLIGHWMQRVAEGWLVLQLTGEPIALGLLAVAQFGPVLALGLFGGLLADQLPKRRTLIVTQSIAMALAFALFALTASGLVEVWHVVALALMLGIINALDMPTRQAFAVEMVGREDVSNAVGLNATLFNASRIVGPAVAGVLIAAVDLSTAFLVNGLSYVPAIVAYLAMRESELRAVPEPVRPIGVRGVFDNLVEGLDYVRRTPIVLLAVSVLGISAMFAMNFNVLVPPLADHVLAVGATGFGFLMAASGIGSTVAALSVAFASRVQPTRIAYGALALGLGSLVLGVSTSYPLSLVAILVAGAGGISMSVTANATIQLTVPDHLRGRVMSVYTTVFAGSVPIGGLLMGAIASGAGVPVAFVIGGVAAVLAGSMALLRLRRIGPTIVSSDGQDAVPAAATSLDGGRSPATSRPR